LACWKNDFQCGSIFNYNLNSGVIMSLIYGYKDRGLTKDIVIQDANGDAITVSESDKIRVVIGREGKINANLSGAEFTVTSGTNTTAGSSFVKAGGVSGAHRLRIDATDFDFAPGVYSFYVDYYNAGDDNEWKTVDRQVLVLSET